MRTFRIVRRAYGKCETVDRFTGSYCDATEYSMRKERENRDGEYFVRGLDQPDWEPPVYCPAQEAWSNL